ncbi:putative glycosyl hydrolase family 61 [Diaporthe ampelina]|uniref:lytic cellulose monooxygenase (C4-dehydrogenating) n=1 Tax=Diaporthe ampelina TaxID=1214573 RepID=A0A0G2F6V0_9PEZI|nr:putative glycosyl hydrolase family 61 [Diaporthe ampelina]
MPAKSPIALALAAGASLVSAHGYVASWEIGGVTYAGFDEQWASSQGTKTGNEFIAWGTSASDNGFVAPDAYADADIICHRDATNGALNNATVAAGQTVTAIWNTWPDSHHGPVIDYLAPADDPTSVDKTTLSFVKIQEAGIISGSNPGTWASDEILSNNLAWEITIPEGTPAGNYVLRHEIIALHSANQANGAQNYPQCVNIQVTGGSGSFPEGTAGTALYTADEEGIVFNIYQDFSSYPIPGPALGFSSSGASNGGSSSGSASSAVASSAAAATPTAAASSSAAPVAAETTSAAAAATTTSSSAAPTATKAACKKRRHARDVKA